MLRSAGMLAQGRDPDTQPDLEGARLEGIDLRWVDLREANLRDASFQNAKTLGLEACEHRGPSGIDVHTLMRSANLPLVFLQGSGLSDAAISALSSLSRQPNRFHSCFISYSSRDDEFAQHLHADLQSLGVRCWFAPEDLKIGDTIRARLDEVIRQHDKLLLVLSEHSVASDWVACVHWVA